MFKVLFKIFLGLVLCCSVAVGLVAYWLYYNYVLDLPQLANLKDFKPPAVSQVYSRDGQLLAEYFIERRYPVSFKEIPDVVVKAILAAEDVDFYSHPGIDLWGIFRAVVKNIQGGRAVQGGSTITQQVVKNLLLTTRKTFERKVKEAILAYQLEKRLTKDEILEIYLNQIYFGNTAYGIKAAAKQYFHAELSELSTAQAALLAAMPKAPSRYSPISNYPRARSRQKYVIGQMRKARFISADEAKTALEEKLVFYRSSPGKRFYKAPYFMREFGSQFQSRFPHLDLERDGLTVVTSNDSVAQTLAERSLRAGLRAVDKRRGWRGPMARNVSIEDYQAEHSDLTADFLRKKYKELQDDSFDGVVRALDWGKKRGRVAVGKEEYVLNLSSSQWLERSLDAASDKASFQPRSRALQVGDQIKVAIDYDSSSSEKIDFVVTQEPEIEGALVLMDPLTGRVLAMVGGYDYGRSSFNRVIQSKRQPGSAFKPIVYLTAIDKFGYTPATIVNDAPRAFRVGGKYWEPANFDHKFLGPITLQTALELSRNLVVAELIANIGIESVIEYAHLLGIESKLGKNLSLALGSGEVTPLELTRVYGVFAAGGVLNQNSYIESITDRFGESVYRSGTDALSRSERVISEESAFQMAHMMRGVIERGTARRIRALGRPAAGKTGTTNNQMDAWFIGYTPHFVCGVWTGFDQKRNIGRRETGGRVAGPIWLSFMQGFLSYWDGKQMLERVSDAISVADRTGQPYQSPNLEQSHDFIPPPGVEPEWVNRYSGTLTSEDDPDRILEYFLPGTAPEYVYEEEVLQDYLESPEL